LVVFFFSTETALLSPPIGAMILCASYLIFLMLCRRQIFVSRIMERKLIIIEAEAIAINLFLILPSLILRIIQLCSTDIDMNKKAEGREMVVGGTNWSNDYRVYFLIDVFSCVVRSNIDPLISYVRLKSFRSFIDKKISYMKKRTLNLILKILNDINCSQMRW
jgi:hypothetical protein